MENQDLFISCFKQTNSDINILREGTLIKIKNLPNKITKNEIKIWISHFVEPAYVDLNNEKKECIIRFSYPIFADSFINLFKEKDEIKLNEYIVQLEKLEGEEEKKYIEKVKGLQEQFEKNKKNKKQKFSEKPADNNLK